MASQIHLEKLFLSIPLLLKVIEKERKISFSDFKKLFDIHTNKELFKILEVISNLIYDKLSGYLLIETKHDKKKESYIYFELPDKEKPFVLLPLNNRDLELLIDILSEDPQLLEKIINIFPFITKGHSENVEILKENLKELCLHNQNIFFDPKQKKKEVHLYYKKPLSQNLQLKKIIPLSLRQLKNLDYIIGYDIKDAKLKIYRLDRILYMGRIIETMLNIPLNLSDLEDVWNSFIKINQNVIQIRFVYHPTIEINLKNYYDFEILEKKEYRIENENWKIGVVETAFPDSFLEKILPFAGFVYILEPKDLNSKIVEYFKKVLNAI